MSDTSVQNEPDASSGRSPQTPSPPDNAARDDKPSAQKSAPARQEECVFNDSITVYPDQPLPQYNRGPVKAYAAAGRDKAPAKLFALICEDHLTPRTLKAPNYVSILNPSLVRLVGSGKIDWAPQGRERYCFIYEDNLGAPIMKDDTRGGLALKPEYVLNAVVRPIVSVLQDLRDKDLVHGNIRPSNLFNGGRKNFDKVILGECLCLPVSYDQPAMYESVERAMCAPIGRGVGTLQDDLYSFGVTLGVLMRHFDPLEGLSEDGVIERKIEEGTYISFLNRDRFSGAMLELLRGLLYDDPNQRWNLDDVLVWMDGRRLSPKQAARRAKANRPFIFNGEKYIRPELLAHNLNKNIAEAKQHIENGDLEQWLSRALEDKVISEQYHKALALTEESGRGAGYPERLVTRTAIALYPEGPIQYKSISIHPDGIGKSFTEAFMQKRDLKTYTDFFNAYFITQWIDAQSTAVSDVSGLVNKYDSLRAFLRQPTVGSGLERCLYWLNPEMHCVSEKLAKFHVRSPEDMMYAFEKISKSPSRPALFFDRHISAFLSTKDRKNIDPYLHDLNATEPYKRVMGEFKTLATIQKRSQMEEFPGICAWMYENLEPVYERFHDRKLRVELKRKAERLISGGDLNKMLMLFDSPVIYQEDNINFRKSMRYYYDLERELATHESSLRDESSIGIETGNNFAALTSALLAGIIIIASIIMATKSGSLF